MSIVRDSSVDRLTLCLTMAAALATVVGVGIGILGPTVGITAVVARVIIGWGGSALAAIALGTLVARHMVDTRRAQLYLERLNHQKFDSLPSIDNHSAWYNILETLRESYVEVQSRAVDAEQSRAALEVRYRRCLVECERMQKILAVVSEPLIAVDAYDEVLLTNNAAERLLELQSQPTEKRVLGQIRHCEKLLSLIKDTQRRKTPSSRTEELEIEQRDGSRRWYSASVTSLQANADQEKTDHHGVVAVLRDISSLKQVQRHNAEFVSNASHEMKAPLAGIRAYVELLADGEAEDEETREEFLKVINSQTDRLQRLVDNLLNLARIEAGVVKVHKHQQPVNEILAEAFSIVQPSAEAKQIELVSLLSEMYLGSYVDRDLMLQTAINLLSNAVKYTPNGGKVVLRSRLLGDEVQFEVEDTGVGLSPEDCDKVFEKFYRVDKDKNMAAGTGLGLPLAKYIVEDVHGGRLSVKSQLNVGSTFMVNIPAASR